MRKSYRQAALIVALLLAPLAARADVMIAEMMQGLFVLAFTPLLVGVFEGILFVH